MDLVEILLESIGTMIATFVASLPRIIAAVVVLALFYLLAGIVLRTVERLAVHQRPSLRELFGRLAFLGTLLLGIVLALGFFGLSIGQMFASLGVAGIVIGFAFKDLLENFVAGVFLLWREPFVEGDRIKSAGREGVVKEINFRSTVLVTDEGTYVFLPNATLFTQPMENLTPEARRAQKSPTAEGQQSISPAVR